MKVGVAATLCALGLLVAWPCPRAEPRALDDAGLEVRLPVPACRIISLSPHATELVFAAGAGECLRGVTAFSDYPPAARTLPQVGDAAHLDRERLLALRPDLVIVWPDGNRPQDLTWLERRGIPLFRSNPQDLMAIAANLRAIGRLAGTDAVAEAAARAFEARLQDLRERYRHLPRRRVFYQLWSRPLLALGQDPLIQEALALCGMENLFRQLHGAAPAVSRDAVILADPDAILAGDTGDPEPFAWWRRWPQLRAVALGRLLVVPADLLQRPTPRILEGVAQVCIALGG